jgi:signal recognition particle subunit SRP54
MKSQLETFAKPGLVQRMLKLMPGMGDMFKMMEGEDTEGGIKQSIGIINSMTPQERANPKVIEPSRRMRIANGAGVQPQQVNELVKQFEQMKPLVTGMAGKGMKDRMKMVQELQDSGMMNPGARGPKTKQSTGRRMTPEEKRRKKKEREKELRKRRRKGH